MLRTIVITSPCKLSVRQGQLVVKSENRERTVPLEDLGYLLIEQMQTSISSHAMSELAAHNVVVVFCDQKHHPVGYYQAFQSHNEHSKRVQAQVSCSEPLRKRLWQQVIQAKVGNQAMLLELHGHAAPAKKLRAWGESVKSGDGENIEARAAQHYWKHFHEDGTFRRNAGGGAANNLLNYGYAIMRALIARSIVGAGLLPVLGLHHRNKYNPFCLADDLMEPYRPFVDRVVRSMVTQGYDGDELSPEGKRLILEGLVMDVALEGNTSPLMVASERTAVSLAHCFLGEKRTLLFPTLY